jgi:hypothetical protein
LADYLAQFTDLRTEANHAAVIRNGHHPARPVQTGIGPVSVRIPKVRSKDAASPWHSVRPWCRPMCAAPRRWKPRYPGCI